MNKEKFYHAVTMLNGEIENLSSELSIMDELLIPYKGTFLTGVSGVHGRYGEPELNRLAEVIDCIRKQADKLRAMRVACSLKLRKYAPPTTKEPA